jgi:hypothetical protein
MDEVEVLTRTTACNANMCMILALFVQSHCIYLLRMRKCSCNAQIGSHGFISNIIYAGSEQLKLIQA